MNMTFNLWELREGAGLTQSELALRTSIDAARISRLEKDPSKVTLEEWLKLSNALGVTVEHAVRELSPDHGLKFGLDEDAYDDLRAKARAVRGSASRDGGGSEDRDLPGLKDVLSLADTLVHMPRVVITGPFDAGKSTLVNLLLGDNEAVPARYSPTTSMVTYIRHIDERPTWLKDDVALLDDSFDAETWLDQEKVAASTLLTGDLSILRNAVHGTDGLKNAATALVFHPAPVLRNCTIVDTPGDDNDDLDASKTFQAVESRPIDVLVYMSPVTGFLGGAQIAQLDARIQNLATPGSGLPTAANLFVVMSHAAPSRIPDDQIATVFASAATRFGRSVGADLAPVGGATSDTRSREVSAVLADRMFAFYRGIGRDGSRGQDLLDDLARLLGTTLPAIAARHATEVVGDYADKAVAHLERAKVELDELDSLAEEAGGRIDELAAQVEASRASVATFERTVAASVRSHRAASLATLPDTLTKELGAPLIEKLIRTRYSEKAMALRSSQDQKKGRKKLAQEEMPGLMAKRAFAAVERDLQDESEKFAAEVQTAMDDLRTEFRKSAWVGRGDIPIDFDGAFIGGAMGGVAVGALALWASTLGNLGAYIIAAQAAGWLATLGISLPAGGATLTAGMAAMGGPVGVAVAIVAVCVVIGMQFKDDWETRLAKNISEKLQRNSIKDKGVKKDGLPVLVRNSIESYWDDTANAARSGAQAIHDALTQQLEEWEQLLAPDSQERRAVRRSRIEATLAWVVWLRGLFPTPPPSLI